jgi:ankyrin repeat protein
MIDCVRPLFYLGLVLLGVDVAHARVLNDAENATLQACKSDPAASKTAAALGGQLGMELNADVAAVLVQSGCRIAVQAFVSEFQWQRAHQHQLGQSDVDAMVLGVVKDPHYFDLDDGYPMRENFLQLAGAPYSPPFQSPQLYQLFYDSIKRKLIESPTSFGPTSSHHWSAPDYLLIQKDMPNIEEPVAALLQLMTSACQATRLIRMFEQRHYLPVFDRLRALYLGTPMGLSACDQEFTEVMASLDTPATTDAILERLRWLFDQPAGAGRDRQILSAANAFSYMPVSAQIEHAALEGELRSHLENPALLGPGQRYFDHMQQFASKSREFTPENLSYWIAAGSAEMVRQSIAHGVDLNVTRLRGESALSQALTTGRLDIARPLVEAGANVNHRLSGDANSRVPGGDGRPMLSVAVCARPKPGPDAVDESAALVSLLLAHGARVNESEIGGITALHLAAGCANTATLAALLAASADINAKQSPTNGQVVASVKDNWAYATPLHYAAKSQRPGNVAYLLDHKANINARTANGATPLWWAVAALDLKVVTVLLDRGADINLAADGDLTPVVVAHESITYGGHGQDPRAREIEALLKSRGAFLNPITIAKHKLLVVMLIALMATSSGEGFH